MLVLSFPEFNAVDWMPHRKWFNNYFSGIISQSLKRRYANTPSNESL